ncbi:hypothetical protein [Hymenobacter weizhouensis]|uniref:hypothetical protein n=1 Tax=Hymenobacter sp. YIM 151500-1 TaxID=2987689 RepID=UPI002226F3DB|nr:hypothetical protein [Hymenobacter sp. YIM 151500-1]UYZ63650.1 hypothetical protein OIS53_02110 [Hymenobacter sp. YIM 151500-1]
MNSLFRLLLLLMVVVGAGPQHLLAQQADQDEATEPADAPGLVQRLSSQADTRELLLPTGSGLRNQAVLLQQGANNRAEASQIATAGNLQNLVQLQQVGVANVLELEQRGNGLVQTVEQRGNQNQVSSRMQGTAVESAIRQHGDLNSVSQDLNVDQRQYVIEQLGNRNELVQRENGADTPVGYEVRMTGNMRVVIEHGPARP